MRMKSYNCFYSALFELLEPYYYSTTPLLLNNRWQFFYKLGSKYSDDKRFVGEYPMLYDQHHIDSLKEHLHITVNIEPNVDSHQRIQEMVTTQGFALIFANKCCFFNPPTMTERCRCVTTVKVKASNGSWVCDLYDPDIRTSCILSLADIIYAWENASEYPFLNRCIIEVNANEVITNKAAVLELIVDNMTKSAITYLYAQEKDNGVIYGRQALYVMADDIGNWDYNRFIDGAMYIQSVNAQRKSFMQIIKNIDYAKSPSLINRLTAIIEMWNSLQMTLYLVAKRQQLNAFQHIRKLILDIAQEETDFMSEILDLLYHRYMRIARL